METTVTIRALTPALCEDWLEFFDNAFCDHEDWATCYCLEGHLNMEANEKLSDPKERREKAIALIRSGEMHGYLAYENGKVVGWCNANDRENYEYLSDTFTKIGYTDKEANRKIKSIFCFLIAPKSRGKGVATQLLKRVCEDAEKDGYSVVEAYPFADEAYAFQYHGTAQMYEKNGFCEIADLKYVKVMQKKFE